MRPRFFFVGPSKRLEAGLRRRLGLIENSMLMGPKMHDLHTRAGIGTIHP